MKRIFELFSSLRLTVACLLAASVLVFVGTLAQVELGLWEAQRRYFQSLLVFWRIPGTSLEAPVWPGGFLLGWTLVLNLICAHAKRFRSTIRKPALLVAHAGLVLLLVGQFATELLQVESSMRLEIGETKTYSESIRRTELAVIETVGEEEMVTIIPEKLLARGETIEDPRLPFAIRLSEWKPNSTPRIGPDGKLRFGTAPITRKMDELNLPSARITIDRGEELEVSTFLSHPQMRGALERWARENGGAKPSEPVLRRGEREHRLSLRFARQHNRAAGPKPCAITLLDFRQDRYEGTSIPKNYASRIRLHNPNTGEERETLIYMNTPFRYGGKTYYQGGFDPRNERVTVLQVVENPVWLSPYIACAMVGAGLLVHLVQRLFSGSRAPSGKQPRTEAAGKLPRAVALIAAAWAVLQLFPGTRPTDEFGRLPVHHGGRIQPVDSLARNSLLAISGKSQVELEDGRLSAVEWLREVLADPAAAETRKIFRLENLDLRALLNAREGRLGFVSWQDLRPHLPTLQQEAARIQAGTEPGQRTGYERDLLHLVESLMMWRQLKSALSIETSAEYRDELRAKGEEQAIKRAAQEAWFNRVGFFYKAMLLYVAAAALGCAFWIRNCGAVRATGAGVLWIALGLHTAGLMLRVMLHGRPPVTNLYSSAVFVGWGGAVLAAFVERQQRNGMGLAVGGLIGFVTLIVAHHLAADGDTMHVMQAVLDTNVWLATHVVIVSTGYAAMFVAGAVAAVTLVRQALDRSFSKESYSGAARTILGTIGFATLFSFVGTVLGGIWADQSWGRFWGWDPKENGALMIVLWCAVVLHARLAGLIRERGMIAAALVGNVVTAFSWFGVNLLGVGLHTYGFMEGAFKWLAVFSAAQIGLIVWAARMRGPRTGEAGASA